MSRIPGLPLPKAACSDASETVASVVIGCAPGRVGVVDAVAEASGYNVMMIEPTAVADCRSSVSSSRAVLAGSAAVLNDSKRIPGVLPEFGMLSAVVVVPPRVFSNIVAEDGEKAAPPSNIVAAKMLSAKLDRGIGELLTKPRPRPNCTRAERAQN